MGLHFTDRRITDGVLNLLQNIYFYTGRWGFSVASFTGENEEYWEALPRRLRSALGNPRRLESIIAELEGLAEKAEERRMKHQILITKDGFQRKEVVVNEQLLSVLSALPHDLLGRCLRSLTSDEVLPAPARLVERHLGTKEQLIEPDFLVMADRHLLMGELKIKASSETSDTKYDANQLCNYLSLAVKSRQENTAELPQYFSHLVLLPTIEHRWFVRGREWVLELQTGPNRRMRIDPEACFTLAHGDKKQRYVTNGAHLASLLNDIPVFCRTYRDLADALYNASIGYPLEEHWRYLSGDLRDLAKIAFAGVA